MPATAGRVRMPANNRVHSSAALQTHGIWQSAIGYDPYAPDQKEGGGGGGSAAAASKGGDGDNAYDSFQGLLQLAKLTGSNADEARGACRKCHRVGHLTFQCRNFLTAKEDVTLPAEVAAGGLKDLEGSRKKAEKKAAAAVNGEQGKQDEPSEDEEESDVSDSSDEDDRARMLAEAARARGLLPGKARKGDHSRGSERHSGSANHKDGKRKQKKEKKKKKKSSKKKKRDSDSEDSESESDSEDLRRHRKKRKRKEKERDRKRRHHKLSVESESGSSDSESGREKRKRSKKKSSKSNSKSYSDSGSE